MELWARIGDEKVKLQGSMVKVMEEILERGKDKEVQLLSFHAGQKERRRLKRELRAAGKNLVEAARNYVRWFYTVEARKLRRQIKELKKKERVNSKGIRFLPKGVEERIAELQKQLEAVNEKLASL
jgi:predicted  nucleic acid-binding Zn-ribbon protein